MALTAVEVRSLKPRDRAYKVSDSGGLQVHVQPTGQRYWRYAFRWAGRQQTMALGVFPAVSLSEARAKRDAAKKVLASGTNPATVAREEKRAALLAEQVTFKVVAEEWVAKSAREGRAEVTLSKKRWMLAFAYPQLGSRPINRITAHEVYEVLRKVEARGLHETARRLRGTCGQVFRYAVATARAERDVTADLRGALTTPKVKHLAAITRPDEVGDLMCAIDRFDGYRVTHIALRLAPHLFARPGELRQAEWSEIDLEQRVWIIQAEKMKMRRPHSVPLSRQAVAILEEIRPLSGDQRYVFPCQGKRNRPMCENTLNLALQRLGYGGSRMTTHGFRAMACTLLNESGKWNPDAIERQLAHVDANSVRRIYARGEYWAERVTMMQAWSDELDSLRAVAAERARKRAA
ncbi:tyrosine-type recombinase/integrase [Sandaracinobacteroides hominis]|uniref:tyrosine-type recombinase/integrase n=1 Tax=Sandaracinobacteroides hominis TaxID=2780086 RepID=UPI0018F713BA|nr:tyrosine-type recombinase/integrase [Sandaracinobacteroides hominis]